MKQVRLKISESDFEQLKALVFADHPREAGAFLLAGSARSNDTHDILVRRVVQIPKEDFVAQHNYRLEVSPRAINGLIALCEANRLGAVICHSHPEAIPYSPSDDHGERRIFEVLRNSIPLNAPTASLLLYPDGVDSRVWLQGREQPAPVSEIVTLGRHIRRIPLQRPAPKGRDAFDKIYSRQVLAFGTDGQREIQAARVAIVGLGGTGSACAEQLARLGVRDFALVDHDILELSNISRVYGAFWADASARTWFARKSKSKVDVIAAHLGRINPQVTIRTVQSHIAERRAAATLLDRDVIFLCTDDHWGRSVVNQVCYQYLIPVINMGVRIDAREGRITGAVGAVDVLRPDLACLWCKQFLRAERIAAESMPRDARQSLEREGYVEGIDSHAPSVVSLSSTVASLAITLFLQLLTDFMDGAGNVSRLNYDILTGTVTRGGSRPGEPCVCRASKAFGDLKPIPTVESVAQGRF